MEDTTIITIDPGAHGGIAVKHGKGCVTAYKMPETEGDIVTLLSSARVTATQAGRKLVAFVENQAGFGMPGQRISAGAMFTFGRGFGFIVGCLQSTHWRVHLIRPQEWQQALSLGKKAEAGGKTAWKNKLKARAQQLFPDLNVTLSTADALLLMEYVTKAGLQ